jgi:non-specific serine/threonine protein kinase
MSVEVGHCLSHYRLIEKIGEGGMGEVWKAVDTSLEREVALKFLPESLEEDPVRLSRFEREAKAIAALNHPNIVTVHSIEREGSRRFITMELVPGQTLGRLVGGRGLPPKRWLEIAIPLVSGVGAAHERGIAHRDLKPGNVMLTPDDRVKVFDFGLARPCPRLDKPQDRDPETVTTELTLEGAILGTLDYMSPEQIQGKAADYRSDVFSLGVILYEMATGRRPFRGETMADVIASILKDRSQPATELNPELPREFDRVIGRCLERDPARRYASAIELLARLQELEQGVGSRRRESVPSIAVLPLTDMSVEKDQDYFCEGLAEETINALTRIRGLRVVSRTSSFQFKDAALDSREIGDRLGVGTLLEGSVRKAGNRLRVTAELIDVADGCHLWSERYDREMEDVFAIQDEIAHNIVKALELELSPRERRAIKQVATADPQAFDYYLRGRKFFYQYRRRGIEFALQMFSRAIEQDPAYALAYAGIADCCAFLYMNVDRNEKNRDRADVASLKALELDPDSSEGRTARGVVLSLMERHDEAEEQFETALRLSPTLFEAHYFYARDSFTQGKFDKAVRLYEEAFRVRPEDYQAPLLVAQVYEDLGRADEARAARERGTTAAARRLDLNPDDVRALYMGANGLVALGERERGLEWARRAQELEPDEPMLLYNLACIFSLAGEVEEAIGCLERAIEGGFAHTAWVEKDSNLDPLRDDARFHAVMAKL